MVEKRLIAALLALVFGIGWLVFHYAVLDPIVDETGNVVLGDLFSSLKKEPGAEGVITNLEEGYENLKSVLDIAGVLSFLVGLVVLIKEFHDSSGM